MKKFLSILLALTLVLSLSITAFAAGEQYSITVTNSNSSISINGNTYYAYKLFDVAYADTDSTKEGNEAYTYTISTSNPFYTNERAKGIIEQYFTLTPSAGDATVLTVTVKEGVTFDEAAAREMADALQAYLPKNADDSPKADGSAVASNESATIALTVPGYYLVAGQVDAIHEGHGDTNPKVNSAIAVTTTDPNPSFTVKADAPDIDKIIVNADDTDGKKGTSVNVGDTVEFQLDSKVPTTTGYDSYKFIVHDTMTSGLTFDATSVKVTIGTYELQEGDFSVVTTGLSDGCTFEVQIADLLVETTGENPVRKYADGDAIVIKYSATLNSNALTTDVETNTVNLEYSSNPYATNETKTTPDHVVYVYDFDIVIDKFTGELAEDETTTDTKLQGAKFVLYKNVTIPVEEEESEPTTEKQYAKIDATTKNVTWVTLGDNETVKAAVEAQKITEVETNGSGFASFTGLEAGTYYLTETASPTGYNLLTSDVEVKIEATYKDDKSGELGSSSATRTSTTTGEGENQTTVYGQYKQTESVQNNTGAILPATGGIGTSIFYVIGSVLLVGAAILLITKKRMAAKN